MKDNKEGKQVKNSSLDAVRSITRSYASDEEKTILVEALKDMAKQAQSAPQVKKLLMSITEALEEFCDSVKDEKTASQLIAAVLTVVTFTLPLGLAKYVSEQNVKLAYTFLRDRIDEANISTTELIQALVDLN